MLRILRYVTSQQSGITRNPHPSLLGCCSVRHYGDDSKKNAPRSKVSMPPVGKFDKQVEEEKTDDTPDPYAPFPNNTNPETGEVGGPTGPEPTRYGDWEKKGRVTDF